MNPILSAAIGSILRWIFAFAAGWLVQRGVWTPEDASTYLGAAVLAVMGLGWSLWSKYHDRIKFLAALDAPAGTPEARLDTRTTTLRTWTFFALAGVLGSLAAYSVGCSGNLPPTVGPAGKIAYQATNITDAAATALRGVELFTDQGLIAKPVAIQVITAIKKVGQGGIALADALRVFSESKGASGAIEIRTTIQNIQRTITDALVLVPDEATRLRVQQITQPILDALAAILLPPVTAPDPAATIQATDWRRIVAGADLALARLAN